MDANQVAKYLVALKEKTGLTYEAIAQMSGRSVSTVKNLSSGKSEDPRLDTVAPVIFAMGGSIDEMYTDKSKDSVKETSINSIKEIYEQQLLDMSKTHEAHVNNIRSHYEQHREDTITNYERLLSEKDKNTLLWKKVALACFGVSCIGLAILIGLLILEVANPNLGWLRF